MSECIAIVRLIIFETMYSMKHLFISFTGKVPPTLCNGPYASTFGCDSVMCKPGTWSPTGSASQFGPCIVCPDDEPFLGQTTCSGAKNYKVGDINGDGLLSEREVLQLLFTFTDGFDWGDRYQELWQDVNSKSCRLPGITCENNRVTQINLTDASMCTAYKKYHDTCVGLPSELGLLNNLNSLEIKGDADKLRGTIPEELSLLKALEYLNLEGSALNGG